MVLSQGAPLRKRLDRRLPALSSLRGHSPTQATRCPGGWKAAHVDANLGDDDLSAEITDAWMGAQQGTAWRKGSRSRSTSASISPMAASSASIWRRRSRSRKRRRPVTRPVTPPDLLAWPFDASMHQGQQLVRVAFACVHLDVSRPDRPTTLASTDESLMSASSSCFLQAPDVAGLLADQLFARA